MGGALQESLSIQVVRETPKPEVNGSLMLVKQFLPYIKECMLQNERRVLLLCLGH